MAQLVERDLAKVEAAGSSPVSRSVYTTDRQNLQFCVGKLDIGLSPNGKATDSDSVIFQVRILVAQRKKSFKTF